MNAEPALFTHWYAFTRWLLGKTSKFPKRVRFTINNRIDNLALDIVEGIVEARFSRNKAEILRRVDMDMEKIRVLLRICHDEGYLDHGGYEYGARKLNEAGRMVGGWRKQQEGGLR